MWDLFTIRRKNAPEPIFSEEKIQQMLEAGQISARQAEFIRRANKKADEVWGNGKGSLRGVQIW